MEWINSQTRWAASRSAIGKQLMEDWPRLPENQLVKMALAGRSDAYGELVRRHQAAVFNVAYRLTGEREQALDLAQEAFVRAYRGLASFDLTRPFGPWINRSVTNLALNWLKQRRPLFSLTSEVADEDNSLEEWAVPDYSTEPERLYLAAERQAIIRQALLVLPPHYRAVIELRHFQELSYEEIAETLNLSLSDTKSHLFRARRLLRKWLEDKAWAI